MDILYHTFDSLDFLTLAFLIVCSIFSWKIYKRVFLPLPIFLFLGFALSGLAQIFLIVISFLPLGGDPNWTRFIGEAAVAFRAIPILFLMLGTIYLYQAIKDYWNGQYKK